MSGLRIKKHPAFKPVNYTFDTELNSILYDTEKRSVQLILNESEEVILVVEAEVQVEIEWKGSANEILEHLEKNIRKNLRKDGRRSGARLVSGKPIPLVNINMISNVKKEEIVLQKKLI